ncbi:hypothetical protein ACVWZ3_008871 [Bradyrhizobium sp. i1.3.6]
MARNKVDNTNAIECESPSLQPAAEFPRGEIDNSKTSVTAPEKAVAEFVKHRTASAYEGVLSTVAASKGIEAFKNDPAKLQEWLNNMVRVKALSKTEASEGLDGQKKGSSNLTKLRKIAESSSILTDPKVMSAPSVRQLYGDVRMLPPSQGSGRPQPRNCGRRVHQDS